MEEDAMKEAEFKRIVRKNSLAELHQKLKIGAMIIGFCVHNPDPRGAKAISRFQQEMQWIREVIAEKEQPQLPPPQKILLPGDTNQPPPVVIGLKPLTLKSELMR